MLLHTNLLYILFIIYKLEINRVDMREGKSLAMLVCTYCWYGLRGQIVLGDL